MIIVASALEELKKGGLYVSKMLKEVIEKILIGFSNRVKDKKSKNGN